MTMTEYVLNTLYHNHWSFSAKIFKIFLMKTFPLHCKELKWGDRFLLQWTGRLAKYKISARSTFLQGLLVLNILCMTDQQIYISTFPKYSAIVFTTIFLWFQQIRRDSINHDHTTVEASKAENRHLNRYRDVYPYDHSRVVIYDCDETDYINASLVQVRLIRDFLNMDRKVHFCGPGKPSNFTTVIEAKRQKVRPDREFLGHIFKLFSSRKKYAKTALNMFAATPISRLPTNSQLNIFIFVARVSLQTLLQSLMQKDRKSAQIGNVPK